MTKIDVITGDDPEDFIRAAEQTDMPSTDINDWWHNMATGYMDLLVANASQGRAIGRLALLKSSRSKPQTVDILSLYVNRLNRRHGVGSELMESAEGVALGWGAEEVKLEVSPANNPAVELYQKQGYEVDDNSGQIGMFVMRKKL